MFEKVSNWLRKNASLVSLTSLGIVLGLVTVNEVEKEVNRRTIELADSMERINKEKEELLNSARMDTSNKDEMLNMADEAIKSFEEFTKNYHDEDDEVEERA